MDGIYIYIKSIVLIIIINHLNLTLYISGCIFLDESARQTWEGWEKWQESLKYGAKLPVKLNQKNHALLQKQLGNYDLNIFIKGLTFLIALAGLLISLANCNG